MLQFGKNERENCRNFFPQAGREGGSPQAWGQLRCPRLSGMRGGAAGPILNNTERGDKFGYDYPEDY